MSINIYTIQHPLALSWQNCLLQQEVNSFEEFDLIQKLVLALVYEASRKFVHIHQLYLQKINCLERINILDNNLAYGIITNTYISQIAGKKILSIFPKSRLYNELINKYEIEDLCKKYQIKKQNIKILIIQELLDSKLVIDTLNLMSDWHILPENLQICCISCSSTTLEIINLVYPNLNIYTVKLLDS